MLNMKSLNTRSKKFGVLVVFMLMLGLAFLVGSASSSKGLANAQTQPAPNSPTVTATSTPAPTTTGEQETQDGVSGTGPNETEKNTEVAEPSTDQAALQAKATVTLEQAKQTALAKVPGTVQSAQLEDENGKVVYAVIVTPTAGGASQEVKLDATNGTILKVEAGDNNIQSGEQND